MSYQTLSSSRFHSTVNRSSPALRMFRQGAVGEAESLNWDFFINYIDDATGVQRKEPEVTYGNRLTPVPTSRSRALDQ